MAELTDSNQPAGPVADAAPAPVFQARGALPPILVLGTLVSGANPYQQALEERGLPCAFADRGAEAWQTLLAHQPAVVVLDADMPDLDGLGLCRQWRRQPDWEPAHVILLTSRELPVEAVAFEAQVDDCLTKPVEPATLEAKVRSGLRMAQLERQVRAKTKELAAAVADQEELRRRLAEQERLLAERNQVVQMAQEQLLDLARQAGGADLATRALRNVGAALTSAMSSSAILGEVLRASRCETLHRLAKLIQQHTGDFVRFVHVDERGQMLPQFILQLNEAIQAEHKKLLEKLQSLQEAHDQIRQMMLVPQAYAALTGAKEPVVVRQLVADAASLFADAFHHQEIDLEIEEAAPLPEARLEKRKLLQIMAALLQNAHDSLRLMPLEDRRIRIRLRLAGEGLFSIETSDNGTGIASEHLPHLSSFGFTTKPEGRGFGLYSSANLAREMGGSLTARSSGPNRGATFTLTLPLD